MKCTVEVTSYVFDFLQERMMFAHSKTSTIVLCQDCLQFLASCSMLPIIFQPAWPPFTSFRSLLLVPTTSYQLVHRVLSYCVVLTSTNILTSSIMTHLHMTVMALSLAPISSLVTLSISRSREELEGGQPYSGHLWKWKWVTVKELLFFT